MFEYMHEFFYQSATYESKLENRQKYRLYIYKPKLYYTAKAYNSSRPISNVLIVQNFALIKIYDWPNLMYIIKYLQSYKSDSI